MIYFVISSAAVIAVASIILGAWIWSLYNQINRWKTERDELKADYIELVERYNHRTDMMRQWIERIPFDED